VSWADGTPDRPLAPFGRRRGVVLARASVGAYVVLAVDDPAGLLYVPDPGQFYMLAATDRWGAGDGERPFLPRALSVLRADDGVLQFLLEDVGPGTRRLCELASADDVWLTGPLGAGFRPTGRTPVLVGGGVGIAPLAILSDAVCASGTPGEAPVTMLGFRDADHAEGGALLRDAQLATDDGSVGHHGRVTDLIEPFWEDGIELYACGPPPMLEAVRRLAAEHDVPAQLALESPMACGYGACYGCVVATRDGYRRVCVDGPVFDAAELDAVA
jgi:dihydroorotate dehydrogenase electron transfer subunit